MAEDNRGKYGPLSREMLNMVSKADQSKYAAEVKKGVVERMKTRLKQKAKERTFAILNKKR